MPTNWTDSGLLPEAVADRVLTAVEQESAVLALATRRPMPAGVEYLPLAANSPKAEWIDTGARKPFQPVEWSAAKLTAREVAIVTYVEDVYIDDAGFNVEAETEVALGAAIATALDLAVLFGTDAPPGFPPNGIATAPPVSGDNALAALDGALGVVETSGVQPTGIVSGPAIGSALRGAYLEAGALPSEAPSSSVFGIPARVSAIWDSSRCDAIVGAFEYLVIGVRQDISVETSRDGVLTDDDGKVIVSAFESDVTLVRAHARFACAIGKPISPDGSGPITPFATAKWTGASNGETRQASATEPERRGPARPPKAATS
jgi:Phage capsid family